MDKLIIIVDDVRKAVNPGRTYHHFHRRQHSAFASLIALIIANTCAAFVVVPYRDDELQVPLHRHGSNGSSTLLGR